MHRSSSTTRASEELFAQSPPGHRMSADGVELPTYDPSSDLAKKERSRARFAENAVHVIPFVLLLCGIILWFFSHPVDLNNKGDPIAARMNGLTIGTDIDSDGTQTTLLPILDQEDLDSPKQEGAHHKASRVQKDKSE